MSLSQLVALKCCNCSLSWSYFPNWSLSFLGGGSDTSAPLPTAFAHFKCPIRADDLLIAPGPAQGLEIALLGTADQYLKKLNFFLSLWPHTHDPLVWPPLEKQQLSAFRKGHALAVANRP